MTLVYIYIYIYIIESESLELGSSRNEDTKKKARLKSIES